MKILVVNPILFSGNGNVLPKVDTIKDTMIYNMCLGFKSLGHHVTLLAVEDYKRINDEKYYFLRIIHQKYCHPHYPFPSNCITF